MNTFEVKDMTCGHCVSTITKAVKALDSGATVQVDLSTHLVKIEAMEADAVELSEAIKEAGYTPMAVEDSVVAPIAASTPARKGCCCG